MNHLTDSPAQVVNELGDLLAELTDAAHFVVQHLSDDDHSVLPLIERGLLQAIVCCEALSSFVDESEAMARQQLTSTNTRKPHMNTNPSTIDDDATLACKLAALVHAFTGPMTDRRADKRERLSNIVNHLQAKQPDTQEALREATEGLRDATLAEGFHEDVLLCAIARLLTAEKPAEPNGAAPALSEMPMALPH